MRVVRRVHKGVTTDIPVRYRPPETLSPDPSIGPGDGIDLNAIGRVLEGAHPKPKLTDTEARVAWLLLDDSSRELWASEIAGLIGVHQRTVVRWRVGATAEQQIPAVREGDPMEGEWRHKAMCGKAPDPDLWFPAGFQRVEDRQQAEDASEVCFGSCPVREECLHAAMVDERSAASAYRFGVWGGLTPTQRADLQKEINRRAEARRAVREVGVA